MVPRVGGRFRVTYVHAEPFVWSSTVDAVLEKVSQRRVILGTYHWPRTAAEAIV